MFQYHIPAIEKRLMSYYKIKFKSTDLQGIEMNYPNTHERSGPRAPRLRFLSVNRDSVKWNVDPIPETVADKPIAIAPGASRSKINTLSSDLALRWSGPACKWLKDSKQRKRRSWREIPWEVGHPSASTWHRDQRTDRSYSFRGAGPFKEPPFTLQGRRLFI